MRPLLARRNLLVTMSMSVLAIVAETTPARAELAFFANGRTLSVKSHRVDGESLVLVLRGGGEIICELSVIARIEPDEVPYPEPETTDRAVAPAALPGLYDEVIERAAAEQGVPARLVKAVIQVESAYQHRARSRKGAMGLMQLMPETARQYSLSDPYEPRSNIEAGIKHLRALLGRFELPLALAAYNAGEAAVERFGGIPPYPETRGYVARVLELFGK